MVCLAVLVLAAGTLLPLTQGSGAAAGPALSTGLQWHTDFAPVDEAPVVPTSQFEYVLDPEAMKETFRERGTITILTGSGAPLVVTGEETDLFWSRDVYEITLAKGRVKIGEIASVPMHGTVEGARGSTAALTLGDWGIYGVVETPAGSYALEPRRERETFVQVVRFHASGLGADLPDPLHNVISPPRHTLSTTTISRVWVNTDNVLANAKPNWQDLATSAFNQHKTTYLTDTKVMLDLRIDSIGVITDQTISATGICDNTGNNYVSYLIWYFNTYYGPWWHQAHQFWSGYGPTNGYGCGLEDRVTSTSYANPYAASVVSGVDIGTGYDVDSLHHRAKVSGHELAHNYGSGHNYATNALGKYELMASGMPLNSIEYFFGSTSRSHLHCRYYHNTEPTCS